MGTLSQDVRFGIRLLGRRPLSTAAIVLSLALGVVLNAAVFSLVSALLLRPMPGVAAPGEVISLYTRIGESRAFLPVSYPNFEDLRRETRQLSGLAAYQSIKVGLALGGEAEMIQGAMVSSNYFEVLGVLPFRGSFFDPREEASARTAPEVVLSSGLWQRRFAADRGILGRTISLNGNPITVIGVAPPGFRGTDVVLPAQLWVPLTMVRQVSSAPEMFPHRGDQTVHPLGRLRPGVTLQEATVELQGLESRLIREYPDDNRDQSLSVLSLAESALEPNRRTNYLEVGAFLLAAAGLLLLVASINVANLLLIRLLDRRAELALRLHLGASRGQLARQLLTESLLLTAVAGAFCLCGIGPVTRFLWKFRPPTLSQEVLFHAFDLRVLAFGLLATLTATALFGLPPLLQVFATDLKSLIQGRAPTSRRRFKLPLGSALVTLQVALGVVAMACAGFFIASLTRVEQLDPGFETRHLAVVSLDFQSQGYDQAAAESLQQQIRERVASLPSVRSVAFASNRLLNRSHIVRSLSLSAVASAATDAILALSNSVDPAYFRTVGLSLRQGREFDQTDRADAAPVAIVNETLAKKLWPGKDAVGRRFYMDGGAQPIEVVGVAQDSKLFDLDEQPMSFLYLPAAQHYSSATTLHALTAGDSRKTVEEMRSALRAVAPTLPLIEAQTIQEILDQANWWRRAAARLLALLAGLALFLSALGVYSVTDYALGQRSFEIGIRIALGARRRELIGLIVRQGVFVAFLGVVLGFPAALFLRRLAQSVLYETEAASWFILLASAGFVLAVSLIANLVPAMRAFRAEPTYLLQSRLDGPGRAKARAPIGIATSRRLLEYPKERR